MDSSTGIRSWFDSKLHNSFAATRYVENVMSSEATALLGEYKVRSFSARRYGLYDGTSESTDGIREDCVG